MSEAVISVRGLSKLYRIGARRERYRTFRDAIAETVAKPFRRHDIETALAQLPAAG